MSNIVIDIKLKNVDKNVKVKLWTDYIFLTNEERIEFLQKPKEYLIEQVHYNKDVLTDTEHEVKLNFMHPIKELIWKLDDNNHDTLTSAVIKFNQSDIFVERLKDYFTLVQRYNYHTSKKSGDKDIYLYSFSLNNNNDYLQPFGYVNFTNLDKKSLLVKGTWVDGTITIYAINYNILSFKNGKCILKYFN